MQPCQWRACTRVVRSPCSKAQRDRVYTSYTVHADVHQAKGSHMYPGNARVPTTCMPLPLVVSLATRQASGAFRDMTII